MRRADTPDPKLFAESAKAAFKIETKPIDQTIQEDEKELDATPTPVKE